VVSLEPASHQELNSYFSRHGYDWQTLDLGVPLIIVEKFPVDFQELEAGNERKRLFFLALLPMVLLVNDEISEQRTTLNELCKRYDLNETLSPLELNNVADLAKCYKIEHDPLADAQARTLLFNRLDILPPSLVLAQAAQESAYGTSRFARLGNNLFGEMVYDDTRIQGIVPRHNPEDGVPAYRARSFPTLLESLRAYMINLNTHPAYQDLRIRRAELRARGLTIAGRELADGLLAYSERGDAYIRDIKTVIAVNRLSLLSDVALRKPSPLEVIPSH
jgi:Bax protein